MVTFCDDIKLYDIYNKLKTLIRSVFYMSNLIVISLVGYVIHG